MNVKLSLNIDFHECLGRAQFVFVDSWFGDGGFGSFEPLLGIGKSTLG